MKPFLKSENVTSESFLRMCHLQPACSTYVSARTFDQLEVRERERKRVFDCEETSNARTLKNPSISFPLDPTHLKQLPHS